MKLATSFRSATLLALVVALLAFAGCADRVVAPEQENSPVSTSTMQHQNAPDEDIGMKMRREIRAMDDAAFRELVEQSDLTVMIGFKEVGRQRGVSKRGKALLSSAQAAPRADHVAQQFASDVIYRFKHIPAIAVRLPNAEAALQLRKLPWVDYVAPGSGLVTPDEVSAACYPIEPQVIPWNIEQVGADDAWSVATGNAPKSLVVLDDGADEDDGWYDQELYWISYTYYVPSTYWDGNHGTPVLGAAQAGDNAVGTVGVAPDAEARVTKIVDPTTGDPDHQNWEANAAIAIDDHATLATVMTISYSTKITSPDPPPTFVGLHSAMQNAYYQHDVLFTASTGNQSQSDYYAFPANFDEVIGVGGSDRNDNYIYNNYAPGNVEIAAPAIDVLTVCKGGDVGPHSGTSFATPMVAGAVMLLREEHPNWTNEQVREQLRNTAEPMANSTKSGAGRLDVAEALGVSEPPPANEPPVAAFTYSTYSQTAYFTDQSSDSDGQIVSWHWDFGDGSTSTQQNPSHTYSAGGIYNVALTVTDNDGAQNTALDHVNIEGDCSPMVPCEN